MLALPVIFAANAVAAGIGGPSPARRLAALAVSGLAFVALVLLPPPFVVVRGWAWLGAIFLWMRMVDVVGAARPLADRLALALLVYDVREMRAGTPRFDLRIVARGFGYGGAAIVAMLAAFAASGGALPPAAAYPLRWLAGGVMFYTGIEALDACFRFVYRLGGLVARPLQDAPIRARSVTELWGRRWNREVGRWIQRWCFLPLARRRHVAAGVVAGFAWSGVFHGVPTLAAVGALGGACMAGFFLLHGAVVLLERHLRVERWPGWVGHVWTVAVFVVTGPLFVEPGLRLMGVGWTEADFAAFVGGE